MSVRRSEKATAPDLRQRILEASEQLLETEGLAALSMREVARRSGVTHQAPYHHFADRESILGELVTQGFVELARRLALANQRNAGEGRHAILMESGQAYVGFAIDRPGIFRIMFRPEICDPSRYPAAREAGDSAHGELQRMVCLLHGESEVAALSPIYWAQVHGLACLIVDGPAGQQWPSLRERRRFMRDSLSHFARYMLGEPLLA
ncbi:TetR/AcrR family transcriptional regulator [Hydrogenophaga sp.]|uniref:TetR/AcrR family transcriptional regulator n=1 Tax=Hydrogenophaga sp. TaxID=1904254 RepID=UPI00271F92DD|nr:TetR/AcrR family transcriptional regulator [Hydrogenophaga sp.]MDO8903889.1 TetR/AcrR family transcriptional regulator [Hydrogenophaga sp.]